MQKKDWFGIVYVSVWVLVWGTVGSLVDLPLLNSEIYFAGSIGQVATFTITALLSIVIGALLFSRASRLFGIEIEDPKT